MALLNDRVAKGLDNLIYGVWKTPLELQAEPTYKKVDNLYEKAKKDQWNATDTYKKAQDGKNSKPKNGETGFNQEEKVALARLYSQLYYGERGAQIISAQMVGLVPHNEASKFLSTQAMDEARHVEIFEKMLLGFDKIYPMNPFLAALLSDMAHAPSWQEKLIGMNMLVEGLALTVFHTMVHTFENNPKFIADPGAQSILEPLRYIIKDEARHVGFGMVYLKETLKEHPLSKPHAMRLQVRQYLWMLLLYGSVKYHEEESRIVGVDYLSILKKILVDHQARVEEMDLDIMLRSDQLEAMLPAVDKLMDLALALPQRFLPQLFGEAAKKMAKAA